MAKEINFIVLCDEIFNSLKAKGCGMTPVEQMGGGYNSEFTHIVLDSLNKSRV